jgi:type II secretory ATPase GspE/PulE/Tfp pilus assembly ATPase PilB-like protein
MPTQHGESVVIRLLARDRGLLDLSKIGLVARDEATLRRLLTLPHGLILITGPTGSGKTTTLETIRQGRSLPSKTRSNTRSRASISLRSNLGSA